MDYIKIEDIPEEFVGLANFMGIDKFIEFCKNMVVLLFIFQVRKHFLEMEEIERL